METESNVKREEQGTTNARVALNAWKEQRTPSNSVVRLQLACDLTIIQGAALVSWHLIAWIANLHSIALHQLALYGGYFCIQFAALLFLENLLDFLDGWNIVRAKTTILDVAKSFLDLIVNFVVRLVACGSIAFLTMFSVFNLRIVELNSFTNILISFSALGNFVLLLHMDGALIEDYIIGNPNREDRPASVSKRPIGSLTSLAGKIAGYVCQGAHLAFHLWPIANSILLSSLVAVIVYLSRKSLDKAWRSTAQLNHARIITRESKQLIWPTTMLFMQFVYELSHNVLKIGHKYAVQFLVSTCEISKPDDKEKSKVE